MNYLGDFKEDSEIVVFFTTHDKEGAAVAPSSALESGDIIIYKGNSATQKSSTNGLTMTSPFDSIVGLHQLRIDTSNDTGDIGFWEDGNEYFVILSPDETIDGEIVVKVLASFSLQRASGALAYAITINGKVDDILTDTGTTLDGKIDTVDGIVDAIKLKTDNLPLSPAAVGSAMTLADDAITSAKFDESTAFPLKSVDTGDTSVARTGADSDTLETLSDQLDAVSLAIGSLPTVDLILDEDVEGTITLRQAMRLLIAYVCGRASGGGTATVVFRNQANSLNRISMTVDSSGNRSAVTLNMA